MSVPLADLELNQAAIHAALAALREGRSTGDPTLDYVMNALGRARARVWARLRSAAPDLTDEEIDIAADATLDVVASAPVFVLLILFADEAACAAAGGAS